jgi:hypothetical protein
MSMKYWCLVYTIHFAEKIWGFCQWLFCRKIWMSRLCAVLSDWSSAQFGGVKFEISSMYVCLSSWESSKQNEGSRMRKGLVASWPLWPNLVHNQISKLLDFSVTLDSGNAIFLVYIGYPVASSLALIHPFGFTMYTFYPACCVLFSNELLSSL